MRYGYESRVAVSGGSFQRFYAGDGGAAAAAAGQSTMPWFVERMKLGKVVQRG